MDDTNLCHKRRHKQANGRDHQPDDLKIPLVPRQCGEQAGSLVSQLDTPLTPPHYTHGPTSAPASNRSPDMSVDASVSVLSAPGNSWVDQYACITPIE